jgi:Tol biopolymer transport system component
MTPHAVLKTVTALAVALCSVAAHSISPAPEIFAPGVISGPASEDSLSFTPDGDTVYFDLAKWPNSIIMVSHRVKDSWSKPEIAPFSGLWLDHDPVVSPDGSFIVFASNRPAVAGGKLVASAGNLWRVDRKGEGWGEPTRLPDSVNASPRTYAPSIARDGSLYFIGPDAAGVLHIFRSQYRDGSYQQAVQQALGDPATHQKDPAIAPDESFIVFDSDAGGKKDVDRFFIAFREGDHWGKAVDLGDDINAGNNPWAPHLGPDGRTLYYTSDRSVPLTYPRSREQAEKDLQRLQSWDDGENNIWYVSLAPWLEAQGKQ